MKFSRVLAVFNESSGIKRKRFSKEHVSFLLQSFSQSCTVVTLREHEPIESVIRSFLTSETNPLILSCGGDGTLNRLASCIDGTHATLAVLPFGTMNHFASAIGLPNSIEESLELLKHGSTMDIDVGEVNGHIFLNHANIGMHPYFVSHRERKRRKGWPLIPAAFFGTWKIFQYPLFENLTFEIKESKETIRTPFVFISCNEQEVVRGRLIRKSLEDGTLFLYTKNTQKRTDLLRAFTYIVNTKPIPQDVLVFKTKKSMCIDSDKKKLLVSLDGELKKFQTPLIFSLKKKALRVLVPSFKATSD